MPFTGLIESGRMFLIWYRVAAAVGYFEDCPPG
jgi:hypothetical protein